MKPVKAVHTWSLFRTMGRFVAPGSMPMGGLPEREQPEERGLPLLELPAALAEHGYRSAQLCHFYLPTVEPGYLAELSDAFDRAGVQLECFLIDEGDLADPDPAVSAAQQDWIAGWLDVAAALGAPRARVVAGKQPPSPKALDASARGLSRLAERHADVRIVTENWHALLPDAASVLGLLDRTEGRIGFLVDLGNWSGPTKYVELAAVAGRAETCQAKCRTGADDRLDLADYRASLEVLRDAGYDGPLALVYDGPDSDEWANLETEFALVDQVFG
jgi:sugar phosphate isomerase/epimerase